jgi:hypothetical protein
MTTRYARGETTIVPAAVPGQLVHLAWYAAGAVVAFAVPFLFSSVLDLQHDLYYLVYFLVIGTFLGAYVARTKTDVAAAFRRSWRLSLVLGVVAATFVVVNVLNREEATPRPDGVYFGFEVLWRGLAYGVVDALLLTAFPVLVAYGLLNGKVAGVARRVGFALVALVLTMVITATYHLGYEQFREDGVAAPETGNVIISLPAVVTTNPLGSVVAHAAMHVAATTHAYETDVFLPPQTDAE